MIRVAMMAVFAAAAGPATMPVTITVHNSSGGTGTVTVGLCDADHFMGKRCPYEATVHAAPGDVVIRVPGVAPGRYAIEALAATEERCAAHTDWSTDAGINRGFSGAAEGAAPANFDEAAVEVGPGHAAFEVKLGTYTEALLREGRECSGRPR